MNRFLKITGVLLLIILLYPAQCLAADAPVTLSVNQHQIDMDTMGYIESGLTYLPIRFFVQALGAKDIIWQPEQQMAVITTADNQVLRLSAGESTASIDEEPINFGKALPFHSGRLFVPISELKDYLGFSIAYDPQTIHVSIEKSGIVINPELIAAPIDEETWLWLARIVEVEAMGQPMENKIAVANVVLNRVGSDDFPDTVYDVIFQIDVHTQFPPAYKDGFREIVPSDASMQAAKAALQGVNNIEDCLFFNNRPFSGMQNRLYKVLNGEYFYR
jgi:hypothetical protein